MHHTGNLATADTIATCALRARCDIAMHRVMYPIDPEAGLQFAIEAYEKARAVGLMSAPASPVPVIFGDEITLIHGWSVGQCQSAGVQAELSQEGRP